MRTANEELLAAQQEHRAASDNYAEVSRRCREMEQEAQDRKIAAVKVLGIAHRAADAATEEERHALRNEIASIRRNRHG